MLVYDSSPSPASLGDTLSPDSLDLSQCSGAPALRCGEGLRRAGSSDALLGNPAALRRRVVRLEERLRRQEAEAKELRSIVATKDAVIRDLGVSWEMAQGAEHALRTKDDIIRSLGASQDLIIQQLASSCSSTGTSTSSVRAGGLPARRAPDHASAVPFSVAPVSWEDTAYHPVPGSDVDSRIAVFSNSRTLKILFARVDEHNNYIYGRLPVHCMVDDDGVSEVGVKVATTGLLPEDRLFALEEFVATFEDAEYQYCTLELERAGWLTPPAPPILVQ